MASPVVESSTGPEFEDVVVDNKLTLTTPAGTVENNLLIASFGTDDWNAVFPADDDSAAGWVKFIEIGFVNGSAIAQALYWLKAPVSPAATYSFTKDAGATVMGGGMIRISGAHATSPIDVAGSATGSTAGVDCPDIPTNVVDTLVLRIFAADDDDYPNANSGYPVNPNHTGLFADETQLGNDMSTGAAWINQAGIGDTGIGTFTGQTPAEQWVAFTVAIAPSVGAADAVTIDRVTGGPFSGGVSAVVSGIEFEAVQGTGTVKISPTDDVDDVGAVEQTVTDWNAGEVTFTVVRGALALDTDVYLFVTNDSGTSNTAGEVIQLVPEYTLDFAEAIDVIFDMDFVVLPTRPLPIFDNAAAGFHKLVSNLWFQLR